jgi:hypothetical protein
MALYQAPAGSQDLTPGDLATEARKRVTELADTTFWVYGQLENYEKNNIVKITPAQFLKSLGGDAKDFVAIKRAMKRLMVKINPDFKDRIARLENELAPKKAKKAAK